MVQLELMSYNVRAICDGDSMQVKRTATSQLLRIMFWENAPIDIDRALEEIKGQEGVTVGGGKATFLHDARTAMRDFHKQILRTVDVPGSAPARYRLDTKQVEASDIQPFLVAAHSAAEAIGPFKEQLFTAPMEVPDGFDRDFEAWDGAIRRWAHNPGVQTASFGRATEAYEVYEGLYQDLIAARVVAHAHRYVKTGIQRHLSEALTAFDLPQPLESYMWEMGLRLAASTNGWKTQVETLWEKYRIASGDDDDEELADALERARHRDPDFIITSDLGATPTVSAGVSTRPQYSQSQGVSKDAPPANLPSLGSSQPLTGEHHLLEAAALLGIADHTSLALESSHVKPVQCCNDVVRTLKFSGIMANKWVLDEKAFAAFEQLLTELDRYNEEALVRFMVVDKDSRGADVLRRRGLLTEEALRSLPVLRDLQKKHRSFRVRTYTTLPAFRLIIVDSTYVAVGPYLNLAQALPKAGWEVPQITLTPNAPFPLMQAFMTFFDEAWTNSPALT